MRLLPALAAFAFALSQAWASLPFTDTEYAIDIPTLEAVVGHTPGEEMTTSAEAVRYLERLAEAAPDRVKVIPYAESWQGRQLVYVVISSKETMANLDKVKADIARLSDGRSVTGAERDALAKQLPAVTWLGYGVHGNEISVVDAALAVAYHLVAAKNDPQVDKILSETIVLIDPNQNPDGRERFLHHFESARGLEPQGHSYAAERNEPWPGGRLNHALFDMNRDWFSLTQPETRGRVKVIAEWNPVATVDAHEMGSNSTYFFAPAAAPFNPQITEDQRAGHDIIGRANAAAFDKAGVRYFTREIFDMFYPGYGETWPGLNGALGMTYEQGSARGLRYNRPDGSALLYADGVANHFLATLTTAATVAENKDDMLAGYAARRASAVQEGEASPNRYTIVDLSVRTAQAHDFAERMVAQGIPVDVAGPGSRICGTAYAEGALIIDRARPNGRLISTLLDRDTPLNKEYMKGQEERRANGQRHEIYDVVGWSVPLMDGLSAKTCARADAAEAKPYAGAPAPAALADAALGYALPWDDAGQARLLIAAMRSGLKANVTRDAFVQDGRKFSKGSAIFSVAENGDGLKSTLDALLKEHGGEIVPMQTSWVDEGPNLGSGSFSQARLPKIAMVWGMGTSPLSAGASRYVLERQLGLPVTPIRTIHMGYADLSGFDVLVLPETGFGFGQALGGGADAVVEFVREGGVVVGFGSAVGALAGGDLDLLPAKRERKVGDNGSNASDESTVPGTELWSEDDYNAAVRDGGQRPDTVPGVLLRATANPDHWLSAGYTESISLFRGSTIYSPLMDSEGINVFRYKDAEELLASGYLWDDVRKQLARKPFVMARNVGDGMVIGFAQDPTVRAYQNGLQLLIANSVVLAPAFTD